MRSSADSLAARFTNPNVGLIRQKDPLPLCKCRVQSRPSAFCACRWGSTVPLEEECFCCDDMSAFLPISLSVVATNVESRSPVVKSTDAKAFYFDSQGHVYSLKASADIKTSLIHRGGGSPSIGRLADPKCPVSRAVGPEAAAPTPRAYTTCRDIVGVLNGKAVVGNGSAKGLISQPCLYRACSV